MTISEEQADSLLTADLAAAVRYVNQLFAAVTLTQGQCAAMVDFCFNIGRKNFAKSSMVTAALAGNFTTAARKVRAVYLRRWTSGSWVGEASCC